MNTSSSHIWPSSSSSRLLSGETKGLLPRAAILRHSVVMPASLTGTMKLAMPVDLDAAEGANIDVLGIGRARMHADLAADDDAGVALAHQLQRDAVARVRAHSLPDNRAPPQKVRNRPVRAIRSRFTIASSTCRCETLRDCTAVQYAERDQIAVGRRVVMLRRSKRRFREGPPMPIRSSTPFGAT